ncbi:MAG: hypothetical protein U1E78_10645 [Gammaproteobacteria bacterium]
MNKIASTILASFMFACFGSVYAYNTVAEDCKSENVYNDEACEGIAEKREFFDKWYRPPEPFYYTTIESTALPDPAWISPDFDPSTMEDDFSGDTAGETTEDESVAECPPVCN